MFYLQLALPVFIPYGILLIPAVRKRVIEYFQKHSFVKGLLITLGAALYPIAIEFSNNQKIQTIHPYALIVSYIIFLLSMVWLEHRVNENLTEKINTLKEHLERAASENIILTKLNRFERYVEQLVTEKAKRFLEALNSFKHKQPLSSADVFQTITQPEKQLKELYAVLRFTFQHTFCSNDLIEYSVLTLIDNKLQFNVWSSNNPPKTKGSSEYIKNGGLSEGSGFAAVRAWKTESIVIIEDINADIAKASPDRLYKVTEKHDHTQEKGSLIALPIFDKELKESGGDGLICVISLTSDRPGSFLNADRPLYQQLLKAFECRIILENRLRLLKGLTTEGRVPIAKH